MKTAQTASVIWQAKIETATAAFAPDAYDGSVGLIPPGDHVVSRNTDGTVASRYRELVWIMTAYHALGKTFKLYFANWYKGETTEQRHKIIEEMKWLMFILIWKRPGYSLSVGSIKSYIFFLNDLAGFADKNNCRIQDVLCDAQILATYTTQMPKSKCRILSALLSLLLSLDQKEVGFRALGGVSIEELRAMARSYSSNGKQTACIPSRIHFLVYTNLMRELAVFKTVADSFLHVVKLCAADPLLGRSADRQYVILKASGMKASKRPTFKELLDEHGLLEYFDAQGLTKGVQGISVGIIRVQYVCNQIFHYFSGARDQEIMSVPYNCVLPSKRDGKTDYMLHGITTKFNHGNRESTRWVTSRESHDAMLVAQKIADVIYQHLGVTRSTNESEYDGLPLFISPAYVFVGNKPVRQDGVYGTTGLGKEKISEEYLDRLFPRIEKQDIDELVKIDPHRAWSAEPRFKVGQRWSVTDHQYRRSLMVYTRRSGLVSLSSNGRQMKHITQAMSLYYAKGSSFAKNIIGDDPDHPGLDYQNSQPEGEALAYIATALFSDERLWGAAGTFIERNNRTEDALTFDDRQKILKQFKKGEISYSETIYGGCTKTGPCDKKAMASVVGCLDNCPHAVIKESKLRLVVKAFKNLVATQDKYTIAYKQDSQDLQILSSALSKIIGKAKTTREKNNVRSSN